MRNVWMLDVALDIQSKFNLTMILIRNIKNEVEKISEQHFWSVALQDEEIVCVFFLWG